jgi:hypothetical protein
MNNSNANLSNSHEATAMKVNKSRTSHKTNKTRAKSTMITQTTRTGIRNGPPRGRNWVEVPKTGRHAHLYKHYTRKILKSNLNAENARHKRENSRLKEAEKFFKSLKTPAKSHKVLKSHSKNNSFNELTNMFSSVKLKSPPKSKYQVDPSVENLEKMFGLKLSTK